ncbi:MAG: hypothetical protein ACFFDT_22520 [Candidatus Hodarchaeota archaeon]
MNTIWFDYFTKQIPKLTGYTLSTIKEESFAREKNVIVQILVCFTNNFLWEIQKRLTQKYQEDMKGKFKKFLRLIKNSISDSFRNALIPSISTNGRPFSLSRFAVLLNKNIKQLQCNPNLKFLPKYRIIHAFEIEKDRKGLKNVLAGFAFHCDLPRGENWAFFDLKISNFEEISTKFVRNGIEYQDLLELDDLEKVNQSFIIESTNAETSI